MKATKELYRHQVDKKYTWDLSGIFPSLKACEMAMREIKRELDFSAFEGKLDQSAALLVQFYEKKHAILQKLNKVYVYAHLLVDQDTTNAEHQALFLKASQLYSEVQAALAFERPELLTISKYRLDAFMEENDDLALFRHYFDDNQRFKPHTLTGDLERILAEAAPIMTGGYKQNFSMLNNADMLFASVYDSFATEHEVTHSSYAGLMESKDRLLRRNAYTSLMEEYQLLGNTFASNLSSLVKAHNFNAKIRGYEDAREASMFQFNVPVSVQDVLFKTVNAHLPKLHDYVSFRKKRMMVSELFAYDMNVSLVEDVNIRFTIEEAKQILLEALAPLGEEYKAILQKAFNERWIDWVCNKGKRSGAYSSGCYGTNPYILLSWKGTLSNLFTLAHELGHSIHSYLTWKNQPYLYASYSIFLAEIASTTNENLLTHYLLNKFDDKKMKSFIINHYIDRVKSTLFRQTQFAEFEYKIHSEDQEGTPLTRAKLCNYYVDLVKKYYGEELEVDELLSYEWTRIPHFYYDFYVYQYSTGFSAAVAIAVAILKGEKREEAVKKYMKFLRSGEREYPIETLRRAGVNMLSKKPIETTLQLFDEYLQELKILMKDEVLRDNSLVALRLEE